MYGPGLGLTPNSTDFDGDLSGDLSGERRGDLGVGLIASLIDESVSSFSSAFFSLSISSLEQIATTIFTMPVGSEGEGVLTSLTVITGAVMVSVPIRITGSGFSVGTGMIFIAVVLDGSESIFLCTVRVGEGKSSSLVVVTIFPVEVS